MAIKPILFHTEMVRAILDGRKACTRRILKGGIPFDEKAEYLNVLKKGEWSGPICSEYFIKQCSPYKPGDILYVRETWCGLPVNEAGHFRGHSIYYYKADGDLRPEGWRGNWHPSIHMPKEAARIWLKVTDVRVERLQECGKGWCLDIEKEGIVTQQDPILYINDDAFHDALRGEFRKIWNSTIKKSDIDRYGWDANPWVWAIEFERCEKPKGEN